MLKKLIVLMSLLSFMAIPCHAAVKTAGSGAKLNFDPSWIPAQHKPAWEIMKVKCIKCHTMERTVEAIKKGIAPIAGTPFDRKAAEAYGRKMARKPDAAMSKPEIKQVIELMIWMIEESNR